MEVLRKKGLIEHQVSSRDGDQMRVKDASVEGQGEHSPQEFDAAFKKFLQHAQKLVDKRGQKLKVGYTPGKKYVRVFVDQGGITGKSAFCFVDKATGDVLKADGWKRPARGPRGSIYTPAKYGIDQYGAHYARGSVKPAKVLSFTVGNLRVRADDEGFSIGEVEGSNAQIYSTYRGRKKNAKAFHTWAEANRKKLATMSFAQVMRALKRAGIDFLKVK
jgi:hypothetical protein